MRRKALAVVAILFAVLAILNGLAPSGVQPSTLLGSINSLHWVEGPAVVEVRRRLGGSAKWFAGYALSSDVNRLFVDNAMDVRTQFLLGPVFPIPEDAEATGMSFKMLGREDDHIVVATGQERSVLLVVCYMPRTGQTIARISQR